MRDTALNLLHQELCNLDQQTLWYADENAIGLIESLAATPLLTVITNRYDIYQLSQQQGLHAIFTDFDSHDYFYKDLHNDPHNRPHDYTLHTVKKIVYRVSKEKALTHFLLNQASQLLPIDGTLVISGHKQDGIKSYSDNLLKQVGAKGKLKKKGNAYLGRFTFNPSELRGRLDDQHYAEMQTLSLDTASTPSLDNKGLPNAGLSNKTAFNQRFYSKTGVFGWNKIDRGTQLLLAALGTVYPTFTPQPQTVLDLGCGYGWIFLNLEPYNFTRITATDNNATALLCAHKNATLIKTPTTVVASDCADTIREQHDLVLCNPPFHQGFQHNQGLTEKFVISCKQHLKPSGYGLFVVNDFIAIEKLAEPLFDYSIIAKEQGFKVVLLKNNKN